jgi:hypothetical protein
MSFQLPGQRTPKLQQISTIYTFGGRPPSSFASSVPLNENGAIDAFDAVKTHSRHQILYLISVPPAPIPATPAHLTRSKVATMARSSCMGGYYRAMSGLSMSPREYGASGLIYLLLGRQTLKVRGTLSARRVGSGDVAMGLTKLSTWRL